MGKAKMVSHNIDLAKLKEEKKEELGIECENTITQPMQSKIVLDSTGKAHMYGTDRDDQSNMQAKMVLMLSDRSVVEVPFKVRDLNGFAVHTREEFIAVVKEMGNMIEENLVKCAMLRSRALEATTIEELNAIKWS